MSAGNFVIALYDADVPGTYGGRVQPETLALTIDGASGAQTNTSAPGPVNRQITFKVSKTKGEKGIGPRKATFQWATPADAPAGYDPGETLTLPIMQPAFWEDIALGATGTYLGGNITYLSRIPESVR